MNEEIKIKTGFEITSFYKHGEMILRVHGKVVNLKPADIEKLRRTCDQIMGDICLDHPKYNPKKKPDNNCPKCLSLYLRGKNEER